MTVNNRAFFTYADTPSMASRQFLRRGNIVFLSKLREAYTPDAMRSFSIKTAVEGVCHYKIGRKNYKVSGANYLIAPRQTAQAYIDSADYTKTVCIDIDEKTIAEAYTVLSAQHDFAFDNYLSNYFSYPNFAEHTSSLDQAQFSCMLSQVKNALLLEKFESLLIDEEWFLKLAEKIVLQEDHICKALNGLDSVKSSTRKETLRRLYKGKCYIDDNFAKNPVITEVAQHCEMSQFHFYRTFRQAYKLTPYQYMMKKRIEYSADLINSSSDSLEKIAKSCGFKDLFTFSKAFKRTYRKNPSSLRNL